MSEAEQILAAARTVVLVDWPSKDVPDTLARAGYTVVVEGGRPTTRSRRCGTGK